MSGLILSTDRYDQEYMNVLLRIIPLLLLLATSSGLGQDAENELVAIEREPAEYPKKAHRKCIEGNVVVRFLITTEGTTTNIEVVSSKPEGVFEDAAIKAVKKWRFEPRVLNGVPVQREETQRLVFEPGCTR